MRQASNITRFAASALMLGITGLTGLASAKAEIAPTATTEQKGDDLLAKRNGLPAPRIVPYNGLAKAGEIVINIETRRLYFIVGDGTAREYPISVGKRGHASPTGVIQVSRKAENPVWIPTDNMRRQNRRLPKFVQGGHPQNPLGPRALYLGGSLYRIHGTIDRSSIGEAASKGCYRMFNEDVIDLYPRVAIGAKVTMIRAAATPGITVMTSQLRVKGP